MKLITSLRKIALCGLAAAWLFAVGAPAFAAPFTPGNLVIYRVGDGSAANLANTGNLVFLDEYTTSGSLVQSIQLPSTGSGNKLIASGTATSEGLLSRSADKRFILLTGYNAVIPTTGLAGTAATTVQRVVARADSTGNIEVSTALTDFSTTNNPRSVASDDGFNLWVGGGAGGVRFAHVGDTTSTQLSTTVTNIRGLGVFGSQLYNSDSSGSAVRLGAVGTGLPKTTGQTITNLPGFPTAGSPYAFFFADLDAGVAGVDTLYVAEDGTGGGQIQKFSLVGGSWTANGTVGATAIRGLTGTTSGSTVTLYGTTGGSGAAGGGALYSFVDSSGYNAAITGTATTVISAPTNTAFRGIAFAPENTTEVRVASAGAWQTAGGVQLRWRTGFETSNLGFNLYRDAPGGTPINPSLIAGASFLAGPTTQFQTGASYTWTDRNGSAGSRYWLEDVDLSGVKTRHGPFTALSLVGPPGPASARSPLVRELAAQGAGTGVYAGPLRRYGPLLFPKTPFAAPGGVKLIVDHEGWYRVTAEQLFAAGLNRKVDPKSLRLTVNGADTPIRVVNAGGKKLEAGDAIEFYGLGADTVSVNSRVYWLSAGGKGERLDQAKARAGSPASAGFPETVERTERTFYFGNLKNGDADNFFGRLVIGPNGTPVNEELLVHGLIPGAPGTLEVSLQGFTDPQPQSGPDHLVHVSLNGTQLGDLSFEGQSRQVSALAVPAGLIVEGANTVSLVADGETLDYSLVESLRLTYARSYTATGDRLRCTATGGQTVSLAGFSGPGVTVLDVTDPNRAIQAPGSTAAGKGGFTFTGTAPGAGTRLLYAFREGAPDQVADASPDVGSNLASRMNGAGMVILTNSQFAPALTPLRSYHTAHGLSTAVIDVQNVYDEFAFGAKDPEAIRRFLAYTQKQWRLAPKYVLLVGDASLDPRGYLGRGSVDFLPTKLVASAYLETASDDWFTDFNGDGIGDLPIGRFPVRTLQEASLMVSKTLAFAQSPAGGAALLYSDEPNGFDFQASAQGVAGLLKGKAVQQLTYGGGATRGAVLSALQSGPSLVGYLGHGSTEIWAHGVLDSDDALALTNHNLSFAVLNTCLNAFFHDNGVLTDLCLGEALLKAPAGGSAIVLGSTGLCDAEPQGLLFRNLVAGLNQGLTIGEAVRQAKLSSGSPDVRRTYVILGDPALLPH